MRIEDFDDTRVLGETSLRDLLRSGDGPERVWAAWELGLRLAEKSTPVLEPGSQPDPGVRCHLVVILAGFGEVAVLRMLAEDDPESTVREQACTYLIRVTPEATRDDALRFLEDRALSDPAPSVPITILDALPDDWPRLGRQVVRRLLAHTDSDVRLAAIEYIRSEFGDPSVLRGLLESRLREEDDRTVLMALADATSPRLATDAVLALARQDPGSAPALLEYLVARGIKSDWQSLRAFSRHDDPRVWKACMDLRPDLTEEDALDWLARLAALGRYDRPDGAFWNEIENAKRWAHYAASEEAGERILSALADPTVRVPASAIPFLESTLDGLEAHLTWLLEEDVGYLENEGVDVQAEIEKVLARRRTVLDGLERIRSR